MNKHAFRQRLLTGAMGIVFSLSTTFALAAPLAFEGGDLSRARLAPEWTLQDVNGITKTLEDYAGKVLMVYFGYTQCPDICPTALAQAAHAMEVLDTGHENVQVVMVTVDPERDTPDILDAYVKAFNPEFIGLYGDADALEKTADAFNVIYNKEATGDPEHYEMNHTAAFYLLDQKGQARVLIGPEMSGEEIVHDIKLLLEEGKQSS